MRCFALEALCLRLQVGAGRPWRRKIEPTRLSSLQAELHVSVLWSFPTCAAWFHGGDIDSWRWLAAFFLAG